MISTRTEQKYRAPIIRNIQMGIFMVGAWIIVGGWRLEVVRALTGILLGLHIEIC